MDQLTELAIKYGTDKWGKHHYTPVYFDLFKDKRESVKKVLEIGVAEGASLFMWRDFFPNATIYGGEIDQKRINLMKNQDKIQVFKCNQSFQEDLFDLIHLTGSDLDLVDLVIDDGSHKPEDQLNSCLELMHWLGKDAIYIIEDVDYLNADYIFEQLSELYNCQMVRVGKRHDDRLIIVRHKDE